MRVGHASSDLQLPWGIVSNRVHGSQSSIKRELIITPLATAIHQADHNLLRLLLKHGANYKVMLQLVKTYMSDDDRKWAELALKHLMAQDSFDGPPNPENDASNYVRRV